MHNSRLARTCRRMPDCRWQWLYYADGVSHNLRLLSLWQFTCEGQSSCPTMTVVDGGAPRTIGVNAYVEERLGMTFNRWGEVSLRGALQTGGASSAIARRHCTCPAPQCSHVAGGGLADLHRRGLRAAGHGRVPVRQPPEAVKRPRPARPGCTA